ncbi:Hypothetical predicted protein [Lynx pardinus]|uniref:Uncharacterized protein n=1 Tax=Lynx pardinus TaxID=191816 RepID=A0A485N7L0_LYNPA|nr:Hypothetical predicted protein [Lynx pardinus]
MGNSLLRKNRCWDCYIAEGCLCLPWKKTHGFEAKPDSDKESNANISEPFSEMMTKMRTPQMAEVGLQDPFKARYERKTLGANAC